MTPERLKEITERTERASEGPWKVSLDGEYGEVKQSERPWHNIAIAATVYPEGMWGLTKEDAEFIAAARSDVPDLVAEVERLRLIEQRAMFEANRVMSQWVGDSRVLEASRQTAQRILGPHCASCSLPCNPAHCNDEGHCCGDCRTHLWPGDQT